MMRAAGRIMCARQDNIKITDVEVVRENIHFAKSKFEYGKKMGCRYL